MGGEIKLEELGFDSGLFGFKVGRVDVSEESLHDASVAKEELRSELQAAYRTHDMKLVYLVGPATQHVQGGAQGGTFSCDGLFPGVKVDVKTTYAALLSSFDKARLVTLAYTGTHARAVSFSSLSTAPPPSASSSSSFASLPVPVLVPVSVPDAPAAPSSLSPVSPALRELAIASGEWSRFRTDTGVPRRVYEGMFEAWLNNSVSGKLADEVFVAVDSSSGAEVGFITLKRKGAEVSIGLLAVAATHRRLGLASMLLSRAALWSLEQIGWLPDARLTVVTQGANLGACATYARFGLAVATTQEVFHCWLPQHLVEPLSLVADQARVPFCRQYFTGSEVTYVSELLGGGGLDSAGRFSLMCAARIHELLGGRERTERVLMVPSGTAALEMAALLCDIQPGDEVILPSYTFSSTANAFVLRGAELVFVDVRPDTLNINEKLVEQAITDKTRAIVCVHYGGVPCEMDALCEVAQRRGLWLVEDAAQGFLSDYKGRQLGSIGHFGCFSFHFTKNIICGEGGAIACNTLAPPKRGSLDAAQVAARALIVWEKGTNRYDFMAGKIDRYEWIDCGSSFVANELACAVLWAQLEQCIDITQARRHNWELYSRLFANHPKCKGLRIGSVPEGCMSNGHIFFVILPSEEKRRAVADGLRRCGVSALSHYVPLHAAPAGLRFGRVAPGSEGMPETGAVHAGLLRLPVWRGLAETEIASVVHALADLL